MKSEVHQSSAFTKDIQNLKRDELKKAIVLREVLGKPKAIKKRTN